MDVWATKTGAVPRLSLKSRLRKTKFPSSSQLTNTFPNKIKQKKNEAKANGEKCELTEQEERINALEMKKAAIVAEAQSLFDSYKPTRA
mgnify:CR=1 FL=1